MSHNGDADKLWRGQCPKCGNFCSKIIAYKSAKGDAISEVTGDCLTHGEVDLTDQEWEADDFSEYFICTR